MSSLPPFSKILENIPDGSVATYEELRMQRAYYSQPQTPSPRGLHPYSYPVQVDRNTVMHYSSPLHLSPYQTPVVSGEFHFPLHNVNNHNSRHCSVEYRFPGGMSGGTTNNSYDIPEHLRRLSVYYQEMTNVMQRVSVINDEIHDPKSHNNTTTLSNETLQEYLASIPTSCFANLEFYSQETAKLCKILSEQQKMILKGRERTGTGYGSPRNMVSPINISTKRPRFMSTSLLPSIRTSANRRSSKLHTSSKSDTSLTNKMYKSNPSAASSVLSSRKGSFINFDSHKKRIASPSNCSHCGSKSTPEWRRGPEGDKTLCNACGLFYSKLIKKLHSPERAADIMKERKANGKQKDRHIS